MSQSFEKVVVFQHIPKTAGTTLTSILSKQYGKQLVQIYDLSSMSYHTAKKQMDHHSILVQKDQVRCITGHIGYQFWVPYFNYHLFSPTIFGRNLTYITFMRDPFELIPSMYYFMRNYYLSKQQDDPFLRLSLEEFISGIWYFPNFQTKFITGGIDDLELAKERILTNYFLVGITERFNESLFLLKRGLRWSDIPTKRLNTTARPRTQLSDEIKEQIVQKHGNDIALYQFAHYVLSKKLETLHPYSKYELNQPNI